MTADAVQTVWIVSLGIFAVVLVVVAILLTLIVREAKRIHEAVSDIWNVGQKIANNTIHIALLNRTNQVAAQIVESAKGVVGATAAIQAHAGECPGCPACVLGPEWAR